MAQGQLKKTKAPATKLYAACHHLHVRDDALTLLCSTQRIQTGNRVIKPKKVALQKQHQMKKKHSAGLAEMNEKTLATKAGHLELLRGGKKDRKAKDAATKQATKGK